MVDLPPEPIADEPDWYRSDGPRPPGPVAEPDDTWLEEPPPLLPPTVRGIHSGRMTRRYLVGTVGVIALIVVMVAILWPTGAQPELTVVLRASTSAQATTPTATTPPPPTTPVPTTAATTAVKKTTATTAAKKT